MSKAELERFVSDLKPDANLQAEVQAKVTGVPALVQFAKERGYDITVDDIHERARSQGQELTDEQLGEATGGSSPHFPRPPIIIVVIIGGAIY